MPFVTEASGRDPMYRYFLVGYDHVFWKNSRFAYHFSPALKHLLTYMFQPEPAMRLTMPEIIAHPWVQDSDTASEQEVKQYMQERWQAVKISAEEALKKEIAEYNKAFQERNQLIA